jgi:predicted DNA-binding protein
MKWPLSRFEREDQRRLNLLANKLGKPATTVLVEAVRRYAHDVFDGRSVDEVLSGVAEVREEYGEKVQKVLF